MAEDTVTVDVGFHVDRTRIVGADGKDDAVALAGVNAYEQEAFEQGVLEQVDEAVQAHARTEQRHKIERRLGRIKESRTNLEKRDVTRKDIKDNLAELSVQEAELVEELEELDAIEVAGDVESSSDTTNRVEGNHPGTSATAAALVLGGDNESAENSLIRSGDLTPFEQRQLKKNASSLSSNGAVPGASPMTDFEKFLLDAGTASLSRMKIRKQKKKDTKPNAHHGLHAGATAKIVHVRHDIGPSCSRSVPTTATGADSGIPRQTGDGENFFDIQRRKRKPNLEKTAWGEVKVTPGPKVPKRNRDLRRNFGWDPGLNVDNDPDDDDSTLVTEDRAGSDFIPSEGECSNVSDIEEPDTNKGSRSIARVKQKVHARDDGSDKAYARRLKLYQKQLLLKKHSRIQRGEASTSSDEEAVAEFDGGFCVPLKLWNRLYKYQQTGVRWLWELHQQSVGGIMGDEMGLGKTLQVIAFLVGLRDSSIRDERYGWKGLGPVLIVAPATVMHQWVREVHYWWPRFRVAVLHDTGSHSGAKAQLTSTIVRSRGLLVTSYSGLTIQKDLLTKHEWHYVILDEGHKIRNPDAQVTLAAKQFRTPYRLILSGSPMQNSLRELWSLFDFVYPGRLGTLPVFMEEFSIPITQGGYANATKVQVRTAYRCACVLRDAIAPYLLRRMKKDVQINLQLPEKNEQVLFCRITDEQRDLYRAYLASRDCSAILTGKIYAFAGLITLRKLCNHPDLVDGGPNRLGNLDEDADPTVKYGYFKRSGKLVVVDSLLKLWSEQGHRVLLFSQSRQMLCILESFVIDRGYSYLRMDGTTSIGSRQRIVQLFNKTASIFVFLLTTRVGGLGLNLTGADRVVIFDPDWNPSTDAQARERAWRIGQDKPVTVYRLLTTGTIEEKIYQRQIFKQFLTNRVLSDPRQRRFFKTNDLHELFTLADDNNPEGNETSALFAGTGSEVKPPSSRWRPRNKSSSGRNKHNWFDEQRNGKVKGTAPQSHKAAGQKEAPEEDHIDYIPMKPFSILDEEKQKKLREMAKKLAQKMKEQEKTSDCVITERHNGIVPLGKDSDKVDNDADARVSTHQKHKRKHEKHHKKSPKKLATVDGVEIPNLARHEPLPVAGCSNEKESKSSDPDEQHHSTASSHDDYVLSKLFKHSGVHSALQHDTIMEYSANPDRDLVEGEAERVAHQAAKALEASRRECFQSTSIGTPTFTGGMGLSALPIRKNHRKPRLKMRIRGPNIGDHNPFDGSRSSADLSRSRIKRKQVIEKRITTKPKSLQVASSSSYQRPSSPAIEMDDSFSSSDNHGKPLTAFELIDAIKSRKSRTALFTGLDDDDFDSDCEGPNPSVLLPRSWIGKLPVAEPSTGSSGADSLQENGLDYGELLEELRVFIAFQADTEDGEATTDDILDRFKDRVGQNESAIFKSMLKAICMFVPGSSSDGGSAKGKWVLKDQYRL